jgi:excinuclease ABC subunit B
VGAYSIAELERLVIELEEEMIAAADDLRFEYAAQLRDELRELRRDLREIQAEQAPVGQGSAGEAPPADIA